MKDYLKKQLFIAGLTYIGYILFGYALGWSAPVVRKLMNPEQTPLEDVLTDGQVSWVASTMFVGTVTGPYIIGYLVNIIGRKPCLFLAGTVNILSLLILALAVNVTMLYCGRVIQGVGIAMISVTSLVYLGEIASSNIRGVVLTTTGIFMTLGTLIMYSIGPFVSYSNTCWVAFGINIVYIAGIFFVPESPVYYVLIGDEARAKKALQNLGRHNEKASNLTIINSKTSVFSEWKELFTIKSNRKALFITVSLNILQQLSGVVAVVFFVTTIFAIAGSSIHPDIATIIVGVTQIFPSCLAPLFVEKNGRKSLLLYSTIFCCLSLTVLGVYFYLEKIGHSIVSSIQWLPLLCLIAFFTAYDCGLGIIPNTFTGEMFTANARGFGSTLSFTIGLMFGLGVTAAFGYMVPAWGADVTFWFYAVPCAVAFVFTLVFVPETKGKTLLEIQEMLNK